jgi:hypothetical protein
MTKIGARIDAALAEVKARQRNPYREFYRLRSELRADFVRRYRANPSPWPDGPGIWYRAEDWADDGTLLATGRAAAMALDPWAADRADRIAGRPPVPTTMPPIQPLRYDGVDYPDVEPEPVTPETKPVTASVTTVTPVDTNIVSQRDARDAVDTKTPSERDASRDGETKRDATVTRPKSPAERAKTYRQRRKAVLK